MKSKLLLSFTLVGLLVSCNGGQSVDKDFSTGAFTRGDGLTCRDVKIKIQDKVQNRNEYVYGEKVNFVFGGVNGLKKIKELTYPVMAMYITNNKGDTIRSNDNLLPDMEEGTTLSPLQLTAHFVAAFPYKNREKYKVKVLITDRKGKGKLSYEMPFTVSESKMLSVQNQGIKYTSLYMWDETDKHAVSSNVLDQTHQYQLIMEGTEGLKVKDAMVYPTLEVKLKDSKGNYLFDYPNIFSEYEKTGVNSSDFKEGQVYVNLSFTPGAINNPCTFSTFLEDQLSDKKIKVETKVVVK